MPLWSGAQDDLSELTELWQSTIAEWGGPFLFGDRPTAADALAAPYALRLVDAGPATDPVAAAYCATLHGLEPVRGLFAAMTEPEPVDRFEMEF